jgi:hypothetical protein
MSDEKCYDFIVGIGLLPSRNDSIYHMGHMWIRWRNPFNQELFHRGYWPVLDDLPPDISNDEVRKYLCRNKVRGMYKVDSTGRDIEDKQTYRKQDWNFAENAFHCLTMLHCSLPDGINFRLSGYYSCSEKLSKTNNCCSWAVTSLRLAQGNPNFIPCERIKRLRLVEETIWGNNEYNED